MEILIVTVIKDNVVCSHESFFDVTLAEKCFANECKNVLDPSIPDEETNEAINEALEDGVLEYFGTSVCINHSVIRNKNENLECDLS